MRKGKFAFRFVCIAIAAVVLLTTNFTTIYAASAPQDSEKYFEEDIDTSDPTTMQPVHDERNVLGSQILLQTKNLTVQINPSTLEFKAGLPGNQLKTISQAQPAVDIKNVKAGSKSASWEIPSKGLKVLVQVVKKSVKLKVEASKVTTFTWPLIGKDIESKAALLPFADGLYIPTQNDEWLHVLPSWVQDWQPNSLTETFSMPFWGVQGDGYTLTYRIDNPFTDTVAFSNDNGHLGMSVEHKFTRNSLHQAYGATIYLGADDLNEPAKIFRQTLIDRNQFVSLRDKIDKNPSIKKLLGAAFVYLQGSGHFAPEDVTNWSAFAKSIIEQANASNPSPGKQIWQSLDQKVKDTLSEIAAKNLTPDQKQQLNITEAFNEILNNKEFYQLNDLLLKDAFPKLLTPVDTWGDGVSTKMLDRFKAAGMDRLWLGLYDGWKAGYKHPQFVQQAESMNYLVATYDSYNTMQDPQHIQNPDFYSAIFDQWLWDNGKIVTANGKIIDGFKKYGRRVNPLVTAPYEENRFKSITSNIKLNSWFVDADGDGALDEDYSPEHPLTQQDNMQQKLRRLKGFDDRGMVVGTENGEWYTASAVAYAHGMVATGIDSKYQFPLYQLVFHDSVIISYHDENVNLVSPDQVKTRNLHDILFDVPPMYHMDTKTFDRNKEAIVSYYKVFSPLNKKTALSEMTRFDSLTPDRLVQRTIYGNEVEIVANYSSATFNYNNEEIPAQSVLIHWLENGKTQIYTP